MMLPHAGAEGIAGTARRLLSAWDGAMARERPEPLIFTAWLRALNRRLYEHRLGPDFPAVWDLKPTFVKNVLTIQQRWCDDPATQPVEDCPTAIRGALDDALAELAKAHGVDVTNWRWGDVHYARFRHALFDLIPLLRDIANLRIAQGGSDFTLNRGTSRIASALPYASVHGAGYRAVYDLGNLDNSRFMQATGQSGNLLSRHYGDLNERWRDGGTFFIAGTRDELVKTGASLLTLLPEGAP
jgi:penicillin amidase